MPRAADDFSNRATSCARGMGSAHPVLRVHTTLVELRRRIAWDVAVLGPWVLEE